jgi:hypothetical protein
VGLRPPGEGDQLVVAPVGYRHGRKIRAYRIEILGT